MVFYSKSVEKTADTFIRLLLLLLLLFDYYFDVFLTYLMSARAQICYTSSFEDTSDLKDTATSSFISFCFTLALLSADIILQNFIQII